jgi:hypothetical protein
MTMLTSTRPVQYFLFYLPYCVIAWTGLYLVSPLTAVPTSLDDGESTLLLHNKAAILLGFEMLTLLALYATGWMGNHYIKVYGIMSNMLHLLITLVGFLLSKYLLSKGTTSSQILEGYCIPQILLLYWFPTIASLWIMLAVPSISAVIPDTLYLGNLAAARNSTILDERQITHVLWLNGGKVEDKPGNLHGTKRKLLILECTDGLGSQDSLANVAPQAVQFLDNCFASNDDDTESENPNRVLIHCTAGASRSPAMVVYWLLHARLAHSMPEAVRMVRSARPLVDISSDHLESLEKLANETIKKTT